VDYGESVESAAIREAREETGLDVELIRQFHVYSEPSRDPRFHTLSVVFIAQSGGQPLAGDDAAEAQFFARSSLPVDIAFDHRQILQDYFSGRY